jgi:hypothetical protein
VRRWLVHYRMGNSPVFERVVEAQTIFGAAALLASEMWGSGPGVSTLSLQELLPGIELSPLNGTN